jgi:general secretion pathway protein G
MRKRHFSQSGFTLLEIMLVVGIISLLLSAGIYYMTGQMDYAREIRIKGDLSSISTQIRLYQTMNGFLPSSEQGLKALVTRPDSEPRPTQWRQLMTQVPMDPWQSEYVYVQPGTHNTSSFDLFSKGQDRKENTPDDLGNWDTNKKP